MSLTSRPARLFDGGDLMADPVVLEVFTDYV